MENTESDQLLFGYESNQVNGALLAMQMSTISYCGNLKKTMNHYLPHWTVVWKATHDINGNLAFIAQYGNNYVVAIRGSILNFSWSAFYNWFYQDFNIFKQVNWPYKQSSSGNPMISQGSMNGLTNLQNLVDSNNQSITDFLINNVGSSDNLLVTGHSLGANLATVFAPYIDYFYKSNGHNPPQTSVMTFAAATAGNQDFAQEYDSLFPNSWRFYNTIDVVPHGANTIYDLANLYPKPAPSASKIGVTFRGWDVTMADAFASISLIIDASEMGYDSYYHHTNLKSGSIPLNTGKKIYPVSATDPAAKWWEQAGQQHATAHYLEFLGGTPILCQH